MPWEPEHNRNSLSPHGIKAAEGHATRTVHDRNSVSGPECPPGILGAAPLNPDPHGRGSKANPYASPSSHRPRGEPASMRPPHMAKPHRYAPDTERQSVVVPASKDPRK
jgi:hypothetical protein